MSISSFLYQRCNFIHTIIAMIRSCASVSLEEGRCLSNYKSKQRHFFLNIEGLMCELKNYYNVTISMYIHGIERDFEFSKILSV